MILRILLPLLLVGAAPEALAGTPPAAAPAIERIADAFADSVREARRSATGEVLAVSFSAAGGEGDEAAGGELGRLVQRLLPGRLQSRAGFTAVIEVPAAGHDAAVEAARDAGAAALLEASLHRVGGRLLLTGTVTPTWVNFWTGEVSGFPRLVTAEVRADRASLLLARASTAAPPSRGGLDLRPLLQVGGRVVAVAVGDADGDGRPEIAALSGQGVTVLRVTGGRTEVLATLPSTALPRSLTPSRDPAGGVVIAPFGAAPAVAFHHSDLAEGAVLSLSADRLVRLAPLREVPLSAAGGAILYAGLVPGSNRFQGALRLVPAAGSARTVDAGGPVLSGTLSPDGRLVVLVDARQQLRWPGTGPATKAAKPVAAGDPVGAGIALADVDGDGLLERVGTAAGVPGEVDRLVIAGLDGAVRELRPVPGAIRALAAGDATGDGRDDVLVAAGTPEASWLYLLTEDAP